MGTSLSSIFCKGNDREGVSREHNWSDVVEEAIVEYRQELNALPYNAENHMPRSAFVGGLEPFLTTYCDAVFMVFCQYTTQYTKPRDIVRGLMYITQSLCKHRTYNEDIRDAYTRMFVCLYETNKNRFYSDESALTDIMWLLLNVAYGEAERVGDIRQVIFSDTICMTALYRQKRALFVELSLLDTEVPLLFQVTSLDIGTVIRLWNGNVGRIPARLFRLKLESMVIQGNLHWYMLTHDHILAPTLVHDIVIEIYLYATKLEVARQFELVRVADEDENST